MIYDYNFNPPPGAEGGKEMREYITDAGYKMMLPDDDERVMTIEELEKKYSQPKTQTKICPKCGTYCYGDCGL